MKWGLPKAEADGSAIDTPIIASRAIEPSMVGRLTRDEEREEERGKEVEDL